jgi:hypothetical protein
MADQQAQIEAQMRLEKLEKEQPKPEFSERDIEFMGARPGIDKNPEFFQMAQGLPMLGINYGTDRFYNMLESAFPVSDFRRVESTKPETKPPAYAKEEDRPVMSAPISRELPSNGYRLGPSSYRLSPEERQIAKASGMSDVDYARGRLRLEELKRRGLVQGE